MTTSAELLARVEPLVSPFGPVARVKRVRPSRGLDRLAAYGAFVGWMNQGGPGRKHSPTAASGRALDDPDRARLIAIAEGAERYSAGDFLGEPVVTAMASDLPGPVMDLDRVPRCSPAELARPGCPLRPLEPAAPMRWVQGVELCHREITWVPAVMACYHLRDTTEAERFWHRMSTGCAVHFDPAEAVLRAILEIIERDIIAILWLQNLPLPVIRETGLSDGAGYVLDAERRHFVKNYLFDATSDLGVPTVYCLRIAEHDAKASRLVGCASARSIEAAAEKALLEASFICSVCYPDSPIPEAFEDFRNVTDGTRYMALPQRASSFSFLVDGADQRVAQDRPPLPDDSAAALASLIARLSDRGMQVIAVDRTPRELAAVGLTAVSVVIPDLQPMTLYPLAQYRAHPRLYAAPQLMGYPVQTEEELNPWPQPFA
jgi:ribosomal protein S12 methylthiotransferase accessory factor